MTVHAGRSDRFDVVLLASGLRSFNEEYAESIALEIEGIPLRVLPLRRISPASARRAGRKISAQIPALEEAIAIAAGDGSQNDS